MTVQKAIKTIKNNVCVCCKEDCKSCCYGVAIQALEEVEQYRALGTVEELKEAREKQMAKEVISWQGKKHICPFCHRDIVRTEALDVHCKYCGQALKWGEEDD